MPNPLITILLRDTGHRTTGNPAFAVRFGRTAKGKKRTAKPLPCVFHGNARQSAHGGILHGKGTLPCVF
jgi:hypothetical protein